VANGNASSDRSADVNADNNSRDPGPITPNTAYADVTSTSAALVPEGRFLRMWSLSRSVVAALLTIRNSSGPVRVTVTSDSYVPRSLSIPVYTDLPTSTATSAVHGHCSAASASRPTSRYFENEVWSNTVTFVRVLVCSAADQSSQLGLPQV
jgi:hypothetical protein